MHELYRPLDKLLEFSTESVTTGKNGDLPYVGLEHLETGSSTLAGTARSDSSVSNNRVFRKGNVLFGKLRPNLKKSVLADRDGYCSTDIIVLRAREGVDPAYAGWVMRAERVFAEAVHTAEGTKMPRTSWARLKHLRVFAPSLAEQERIVEALDCLDSAIRAGTSSVEKLRDVRLGALLHALASVTEYSTCQGWRRVPLKDVVPSVDYGVSVALMDDPSGLPVLRMNNLRDGKPDLRQLRYSTALVPSGLYLRRGDVLFNRTNSIEHVGKACIWTDDLPAASFASYLVRLNPDVSQLLPEYLVEWLQHPAIRQRVCSIATVAVQQVNVNPTRLRELEINFPVDLEEQRRLCAMLATCDDRIAREESGLAKLYKLKQGLADDLLTGRVRIDEQ